MRILIVGAGPAGLTLAYWLHKDGHTPVVIEKVPNIYTAGYMIDFAGSGWDVANRMGIIPHLEAVDHAVKEVVFKNSRGHTTAILPTAKLYNAWGFEKRFLGLDRRDLVETLYHTVEPDVEFRFGTTLTAVCQSENAVTATFADGKEESFDLLVGADGIHSSVRGLVFGGEAKFADYLGYYVAAFYSPALIPDLPPNYLMHVEPGMQVGVLPLSGQRWLSILIYKSEDKGHIPPVERLHTLKDHARGVGWITTDLLNSLPAETPIFMDTVTQIEMPLWSSNRVALIGDAAYCLTLISGEGTSMAMAGAYFLAEELRQNADHHIAFQRYEQHLRPYIEQKQKKARKFAPTFVPSSELRIALTQWAIRLIDLPPITRLVSKQINLKSIIPA
jgi:2-polyprenyl-6-methoxyphenol hydroxylase-like FAD-dependent oxidoreductase